MGDIWDDIKRGAEQRKRWEMDHPHGSPEWYLAQVGINPDRSFGPHYTIRDGRAHHCNERPGDPGLAAMFADGHWRLAGG